MSHNHSQAYAKEVSCTGITKDGDEWICTETTVYRFDDEGLAAMEAGATSLKAAAEENIAKADATLEEINLIK